MKSKKQVIFIHGGEAFSEYRIFLEHLRTRELRNPLEDAPKRWKTTLRQELGPEYEIYLPSMPNSDNAKYEEWKIWFERHLKLITHDVILIGHSLGGYFLAKYLTENTPEVPIRALFLVAAPVHPDDLKGEDGGDFRFDTALLPNIAQKVDEIFIIHSKDDLVVPFGHAELYRTALPDAQFRAFENEGHFLGATFPELVEWVRTLS